MENAELIGLSRQMVLRRQLDTIANNLANMNTAGYKSTSLVFEEFLAPGARALEFAAGDQRISFVRDVRSVHDFSRGATISTGNELDLAISEKGWFVVRTEDGEERYTRNGTFHLNSDGELVTADGQSVLGEGGPIVFEPDDSEITVAADGTISTDRGTRDRLRVVEFENEGALKKAGDNLFAGDGARPVENPGIVQGAVERSNVQSFTEISRMIRVSRTYQSVSNALKDAADLRETAIERLGTVQA